MYNFKTIFFYIFNKVSFKISFKTSLLVYIFIPILFFSCQAPTNNDTNPVKSYIPKYANGFKIHYYKDFKILEVVGQYQICLQTNSHKKGEKTLTLHQKSIPIVETPVTRMACMAHSHWAAADLFDKTETILGICDSEYINDSNVTVRIKNKTLQNIATNQTIYLESLLMLQPQILMVSFFDSPVYSKIEDQGIVIVRNGDYLENHPLGRAEWMIFTAAFFNEEEKAIAYFETICKKYNDLKELVAQTENRPTVFDGLEYNGIWYVSGGQSYMAQFYQDAGAEYVWKDNDNTYSLPLDKEIVYQQGINADYWRLYLHNNESYSDLKKKNRHYSDFKSWKNHNIIYCNNLKCDLFGAGVFQPDIILADFVSSFHPSILTNYTPYYYKPLEIIKN